MSEAEKVWTNTESGMLILAVPTVISETAEQLISSLRTVLMVCISAMQSVKQSLNSPK